MSEQKNSGDTLLRCHHSEEFYFISNNSAAQNNRVRDKETLIADCREALAKLPKSFALTPVNDRKASYRKNWQSEKPLSHEAILKEIESGQAKGFGLRTGEISGGLVAIDIDGDSAHDQLLKISDGKELPKTVCWTSGKIGRAQHLFRISEDYWGKLRDRRVIQTVVSNEQLEIRWNKHQSVLPPSHHPDTGGYFWICSPQNCEIVEAPLWLIALLLKPDFTSNDTVTSNFSTIQWTDRDWARSYLQALNSSRADNYEDWIKVGMALFSVDPNLLHSWESWSSQSSKFKPGECQRKWQSFNGTGIGIGTLAEMARQDGWKTINDHSSISSVPTIGSFQSDSLKSKIQEIFQRNLSPVDKLIYFSDLASISKKSTREIERIATEFEKEVELTELRPERISETQQLLNLGSTDLSLSDYLHFDLAEPLTNISQWIGCDPSTALSILLPVAASLLEVGTQLEIDKGMNFYCSSNLFVGIVAQSGSKKSAIQRIICEPLQQLQDEAEHKYAQQLSDWEETQKTENAEKRPKPKPREYFTSDSTTEAIAQIQSDQPNKGLVIIADELAAIFKGHGQYKNGRGNDAEHLLSAYDGSGLKVNRKGGTRVFLPRTSLSIIGGIQPQVLKNLMGNFQDSNGQWSRFLWCTLPNRLAPFPQNTASYNLSQRLYMIYLSLGNFAARTYKLSLKAKERYIRWYNYADKLRFEEAHKGLAAVYSKSQGTAGRLALILHCLNAATEGKQPEEEICESIMQAAIRLAYWFLGQAKLVFAAGEVDQGEFSPQLAKILELSRRKGWISARDIYRSWTTRRKPRTEEIRVLMQELIAMELVEVQGIGRRLEIRAVTDSSDSSDKPGKSFTPLESQSVTTGSDKVPTTKH